MHACTERLLIDALRDSDAAALFACRGDPRVGRYQGWQPRSINDAREFIASNAAVVTGTPGGWCQRGIRLRDGGALIGDLGLHFLAEAEQTVEIGISVAPAWQGRGLASEALHAALAHVFDQLHRHRVVASVDPRNLACRKLLAKLGLRQEAHFRESLWLHDAWVDDMVFAMLAHEWSAGGRGRAEAVKL